MNKILIVSKDQQELLLLEEILYEIVQAGGELFIAQREEEGLLILEREHPHLVFLDSQLGDETYWKEHATALVILRASGSESRDDIIRPITTEKVLKRCSALLPSSRASSNIPL